MSSKTWPIRTLDTMRVAWSPASHLGFGRLGSQQICHGGLRLDSSPLLERPEGVLDQAIQGHAPGLGHDHVDGRVALSGELREQTHHDKAQQLPFGAEDGVKPLAGFVKSLQGPEEALNGVGGRGQPATAHATKECGQLILYPVEPRRNPRLRRPFSQLCQAPADGALIMGLQQPLHHRLARVDLRLGREVLLEPAGHALLMMKATQDVLDPWRQGGIGRYPIRDHAARDLFAPRPLRAVGCQGKRVQC